MQTGDSSPNTQYETTLTDDDVMSYVSRAESQLERASLAGRGDKEGINNGDMRPKSLDGTSKRWMKSQNFRSIRQRLRPNAACVTYAGWHMCR